MPRCGFIAAALLLSALAGPSPAALAASDVAGSAEALRERFRDLQAAGDNRFGRPLFVTSLQMGNRVSGEVHALVNAPFAEARTALTDAGHWCQILLLHLNTKSCTAQSSVGVTQLALRIGRKSTQPPEDAYPVQFAYRVNASTTDYLQVVLTAEEGPMGTSGYRIVLEATSGERSQTLLRFSYTYGFGTLGQLAMTTYFNTAGRHKVGFSVTGQHGDGSPRFVGGMRGLVERNTMRYYLAIEAWLGSRHTAGEARTEKSLRDWFHASERYPRQLHELDESEYMAMKRKEYARHALGLAPRVSALDAIANIRNPSRTHAPAGLRSGPSSA